MGISLPSNAFRLVYARGNGLAFLKFDQGYLDGLSSRSPLEKEKEKRRSSWSWCWPCRRRRHAAKKTQLFRTFFLGIDLGLRGTQWMVKAAEDECW
jgi:hypothetical protein